ncbi:hypothetical protein EV193_11598 [Herbihabitans rhizosphaerae]|uniref:Uncharacterized protein n=1 Tax=Herbihabitans rhizosphaerae TaxID=1872711 RepID=A0A4Q7KCK7_9PSEU|nr:hypothetical protein EV193_11598 [Herbihabitans rhizosphaerae]
MPRSALSGLVCHWWKRAVHTPVFAPIVVCPPKFGMVPNAYGVPFHCSPRSMNVRTYRER